MQPNCQHSAGIFCQAERSTIQLSQTGTLLDQRLAVKDLFAVAGFKNGAGNPDWLKQAKLESQHAYAVNALLQEGAQFVGLTHTDELAYSLEGNNHHYGAAENPNFPGHACGGSSMGSAAAVAANLADIGLGTDTGGSIRVPASYCGLYGVRPTHGAIISAGLLPLAPKFDTTGWLTQSAALLAQVGDVLLPTQPAQPLSTLFYCDGLFELVEPSLAEILKAQLHRLSEHFDKVQPINELDDLLPSLADTFRVLQGRDIANTHRRWIEEQRPVLSTPVAQRFDMALGLTLDEERAAGKIQQNVKTTLAAILGNNGVLFMPSTPTVAPLLRADTTALRMRILTLTALAGLTGSVQVHVPALTVAMEGHQAPYGYSLLANPNNDKNLMRLVHHLDDRQAATSKE